jgi:PAS domain S-box-containing protein
MSFRYKIALSIFLLEALVMLGVLWQSLAFLEKRLTEQVDLSNKMFIAQLREYAVKEAVLTEDYANLQYQLENIDSSSGIDNIIVLDNDDNVLAAGKVEHLGQSLDKIVSVGNWRVDRIEGASGQLGRLAYQMNNSYSETATAGALGFGTSLAITGMLIIAAVGILIGTLLSRRLEKITEAIASIREGTLENLEVDESIDEIGQLSRFIQDMGKSISSRMTELVDLEEHTRFALQSAGAGAWRWDMINKSLHWSAKNFQLLGYIPNKNKPSIRLWRALVHPEDSQRVDFAVNQLLSEHKDLDVEYRIIRHSGEVRWMRNVGRMYFDHDKQPTEAYGLQIDISRYKNTEYDLWGQIFLLKKMLSASGECIITIGAKQEILLCNAATLFLFGYGKGELFGRPFYHLVSAEEREFVQELLDRDINSSDQLQHRRVVFTGVNKTHQPLPLQMKFEKYHDEEKYQRTTLLITSAAADVNHAARIQKADN